MVRLADADDGLRKHLEDLNCGSYDTTPWVTAPPLNECRVAIVSTAGLHQRGDQPFSIGASDYRIIDGHTPSSDLVMSHISSNFDRTGFQRDINVVFPIDRLRDLASQSVISSVAKYHYSFMGATDPDRMRSATSELIELFKKDQVNAVLLAPV